MIVNFTTFFLIISRFYSRFLISRPFWRIFQWFSLQKYRILKNRPKSWIQKKNWKISLKLIFFREIENFLRLSILSFISFSFFTKKGPILKENICLRFSGSFYFFEALQTLLHHLKIQQRDGKSTLVKLSVLSKKNERKWVGQAPEMVPMTIRLFYNNFMSWSRSGRKVEQMPHITILRKICVRWQISLKK